jgi:hypothetical membrane protein
LWWLLVVVVVVLVGVLAEQVAPHRLVLMLLLLVVLAEQGTAVILAPVVLAEPERQSQLKALQGFKALILVALTLVAVVVVDKAEELVKEQLPQETLV